MYLKVKNPVFVKELSVNSVSTTKYSELVSFLKNSENKQALSENGYFIELVLRGVGFRVFLNGRNLLFQVGFSHFFICNLAETDLIVKAKRDRLVLFSYNKELVTLWASYFVSLKYPDAYKAKGIQIKSKEYRIKEGKKK